VLLNKSSLHNRKYVLKGDSRGEPDKKRPENKKKKIQNCIRHVELTTFVVCYTEIFVNVFAIDSIDAIMNELNVIIAPED
jgi:hypothetical protein